MQRRRFLSATISMTSCLACTLGLAGCQPDDPFYVEPPAECDVASQNQFVIDVMSDYYLWNSDLPDVDITAYESPESLVSDLRVGDDRWTRIRDAATSDALFMEGKFVGLGYKTQRGADDEVRLSFVSDNSPASGAGLLRGDVILGVNGYTVAELDESDGWGEVYGPEEPGVQVAIEVERLASGTVETVMLTKEWIDIVSLPVTSVIDGQNGTPIGYFVMDKFVETTKAELDAAFTQFKDAGASTVIIDLRYNGGGLISVAERLVGLALGADHEGSTAYSFQYNSNYSSENSTSDIDKLDASIGADNIIVLTSSRTLSASELVINALFPYADVTLIGSTTGGKPVGSKSFEFCEKKLFPITFRLVNADGNTDYFDGLPADCWAADDLFHQLGDESEGMLAAALAYIGDGTCEAEPTMPNPPAPLTIQRPVDAVGERVLPNEDWRDEIDSW
jgi:carboxyl-terminal processing protease